MLRAFRVNDTLGTGTNFYIQLFSHVSSNFPHGGKVRGSKTIHAHIGSGSLTVVTGIQYWNVIVDFITVSKSEAFWHEAKAEDIQRERIKNTFWPCDCLS